MKTFILLIVSLVVRTCLYAQSDTTKDQSNTSHRKDDDPVITFAEEMPTFPGGDKAFQQFLATHIHYPRLAKEEGRQGTVFVHFVVEKDGTCDSATVIKGVPGAPMLDSAALVVFDSMPKWTPGKMQGRAVRVSMNVPVQFLLDDGNSKPKSKQNDADDPKKKKTKNRSKNAE